MAQNIFDNPTFFAEYKNLRENEPNYNDLLEQPAMRALLPDLAGKDVLDVGCGFGHNCREFAERGAKRVVGLDLSERMLAVAKAQNALPEIEYRRMDMADLDTLAAGAFDFVYSSLCFHYAADFPKLCADIFRLLRTGGRLLFSQEHPFTTCSKNESNRFLFNENGRAVAYALAHYAERGRRTGEWFVPDVENYHRTFGDIVTALAEAGFRIERVVEPEPTPEAVRIRPGLEKEFIRPAFLLVRAVKCE